MTPPSLPSFSPSSLPVIFMGTPFFAQAALQKLLEENYPVSAVYTQPPKPVGRGYKVTPSPVHIYAEAHNIPVFTPKTLRDPEVQAHFSSLGGQMVIVAAYGLLLPKEILNALPYGCLNIHGSLLPRWRGASPIQRSILAGDPHTGVTIMKMDEGMDTGPIISQKIIPLSATTTAEDLFVSMAHVGAQLLVDTIPGYVSGLLCPQAQPTEGVTLAPKITKEEGHLNWQNPADLLLRQIHALTPWPGCYFIWEGQKIKVLSATVYPSVHPQVPGQVLDNFLTISCGHQALRLLKVQKPGGKKLNVEDFLRGTPIPQGTRLPWSDIN